MRCPKCNTSWDLGGNITRCDYLKDIFSITIECYECKESFVADIATCGDLIEWEPEDKYWSGVI